MAVLGAIWGWTLSCRFPRTPLQRLIEALAPDVLVKGGDYSVEQIAGHESVLDEVATSAYWNLSPAIQPVI